MKTTQPKTGLPCTCKRGQARDNCTRCEGTGWVIDFAAIRANRTPNPDPEPVNLSGRYRTPDGLAMIEWEVAQKENGPEFSACGEYDGGAGQCIDSIAEAYPHDAKVQAIAKVWRGYHLNGMNPGTPEQEAFLAKRKAEYPDDIKNAPYNGSHYDWACGALKGSGLYEVIIPDTLKATGGFPAEVATVGEVKKLLGFTATGPGHKTAIHILKARGFTKRGYRYGERWVYNPLPAEVLVEIAAWSAELPPDDGRSLGECQADEFLSNNGIKCRIALSDSKPANWEPSGHHYRVTLSAKGRRLAFDFWGSVADAEAGKAPSNYDILACVSSDINCPDTFAEFCSEYGDDPDSRKAFQTFTRASRFAERLRGFFTAQEVETLATIR